MGPLTCQLTVNPSELRADLVIACNPKLDGQSSSVVSIPLTTSLANDLIEYLEEARGVIRGYGILD